MEKSQSRKLSRIPNQRKVSRAPRPIKKESDTTNQQKSLKKVFNIAIQQPVQRGHRLKIVKAK